jgi:hypothetical protein
MLTFVVPLKSPKISRDWGLACRLFERCLRAICNQTSPQFRVVVVCSERPEIPFEHPHVHYIEVDFPPPLADPTEKLTRGYELSRSNDMARKNADKARKILVGLEYARRYNPTHCMIVDADDCVSCRLAEFVEKNPHGAGWYFKKGYIHTEGSRFLYLNRQNFNVVCGSSVVIAYNRRELLFANPDFYHHAFYEPPEGVVPLPFPGAVYSMANGDNIYMSADTRNHIYGTLLKRVFSRSILAVAWKALNYWPTLLTESVRREFGLYKIEDGAPDARQVGPGMCYPVGVQEVSQGVK